MYLYDYILHFSNGSTVLHFNLNLRLYATYMTETLEKEIQEKTIQIEKDKIAGSPLTNGYLNNTFRDIASGK